jgi:hypothetical protein
MAKFDVYPAPNGDFWLDCQANTLRGLNTRFVVPLRVESDHVGGDERLNPVFEIDGKRLVMLTHFAAAVSAHLLRSPSLSLAEHDYEIGRALDMLISGF